jgi:hypothetical protein
VVEISKFKLKSDAEGGGRTRRKADGARCAEMGNARFASSIAREATVGTGALRAVTAAKSESRNAEILKADRRSGGRLASSIARAATV